MRAPGQTLILSCYELGHQPLAAATAVASLEEAGFRPRAADLSLAGVGSLKAREPELAATRLVAISVPMHTAMHIGVRAAEIVRRAAPGAHICFYGLYATLNADHLLGGPADSVIGGEFEQPLVGLARAIDSGARLEEVAGLCLAGRPQPPFLARQPFPLPGRAALPPLERYARLELDGTTRTAAAVETTRGCRFHCRHCPIPPVYGGRFFVVPRETVLADIRRVVEQGASHITFADPDFLNGPGHTLAVVREMHARHPGLTFDVTTRIERILEHRRRFAELARSGCLFVVSAVESLSDEVLRHLDKGHTRADVFAALAVVREAGIALRPSWVAFTPWTTVEDYLEMLDWVDREDLIDHVDPVQFSIRLLLPPGSPLAELEAMRPHLRGLRPERFSWCWQHPDPSMDRLQAKAADIVRSAAREREDARATFTRLRDAAERAAGRRPAPRSADVLPASPRARAPRLTEPWFC